MEPLPNIAKAENTKQNAVALGTDLEPHARLCLRTHRFWESQDENNLSKELARVCLSVAMGVHHLSLNRSKIGGKIVAYVALESLVKKTHSRFLKFA